MNLAIRRACLMGHPVAHSRSPMIHGHWLATLGIAGGYHLEDIEPARFATFLTRLSAHGYVGGNVTVPYKESAYRLVARRDRAADAVGAVNTVWFENGELVGGNSDVHGFVISLDEHVPGWDGPRRHAVVIGAGGAARAATYGLLHRGLSVSLANRTVERAQHLAEHFGAGNKTRSRERHVLKRPGLALVIALEPIERHRDWPGASGGAKTHVDFVELALACWHREQADQPLPGARIELAGRNRARSR